MQPRTGTLIGACPCMGIFQGKPFSHHQDHICWPNIPSPPFSAPLLPFQTYFPLLLTPCPLLCLICPFLYALDSRLWNAPVPTCPSLKWSIIVKFSKTFDSVSYEALILFATRASLFSPCLQNAMSYLDVVLPNIHIPMEHLEPCLRPPALGLRSPGFETQPHFLLAVDLGLSVPWLPHL